MAELALSLASAILDPVIEKLSSEFLKQLGLLWGPKGDLKKLKMTLEEIKGVLNSAEQRATTDESVRKWLWDLKDVAYDADDVLDDVQVELLRRSSNSSALTAKVDKLIELWNIEGFIYLEAGKHPMDIGYNYYRALLRQSFFQDEEEKGGNELFEKIIRCSMHDLVHDLACSIAGPEFAFQGRILREPADKWRYLSVDLGDQLLEREKIIDAISKARKLRSFISFNPAHEAREIDMLSRLPYLRVLSSVEVVDRTGREVITALHNVIPRLKHLRLLDLSECQIKALPDAIISLHSLQVLDLPNILDRLIKLPRDMSKLTKLEKLPYFVVLKEPGCTITELQQLNMLRGDLYICGLELVKDAQEAKMANLIAKKSLRCLALDWESVYSNINEERGNSCNIIDCMNSLVRSSCCCNARFVSKKKETTPSLPGPIDEDTLKKHVVDSLQPPLNLERLAIASYDGTMFPSWMTTIEQLSMYQNLTMLSLEHLKKCERLPPLGQLPRLKNLEISDMPCLKQIGSEFYGNGRGGIAFPSLETLKLDEMPNLELWLIGDHPTAAAFPLLQHLKIYDCPKLTALPEWLEPLPSLRSIKIVYCENLTKVPHGLRHLVSRVF